MYKNKQKIIICFILASNIVSFFGCTNLPTAPAPGLEQQNKDSNTENLQFSKVSSEKTAELNSFVARGLIQNQAGNQSQQASSQVGAAPSGIPMPSASAYPSTSPTSGDNLSAGGYTGPSYYASPSAYSAYYPTPYYTGMPTPYFGSSASFEEYEMIDFEEARKKGQTGSYLSIVKNIINPIINSLSADARLISIYGNTDHTGNTVKSTPLPTYSPGNNNDIRPSETPVASAIPSYSPTYAPSSSYEPYQWQFTYASSLKKEVYSILVSSVETLILRQKWGLKNLQNDQIKIDSTEAIQIVEKAVKDKNYGPTPYPSPLYSDNGFQYIYEIPKEANLSYYLTNEKSGLVWNISFSYYNPAEYNYYYNAGFARVNAKTGEIISVDRMSKYKSYPYYYPTSSPSYYPSYSPTDAGSATPYVTPSPTPSTSASPTAGYSAQPYIGGTT